MVSAITINSSLQNESSISLMLLNPGLFDLVKALQATETWNTFPLHPHLKEAAMKLIKQ